MGVACVAAAGMFARGAAQQPFPQAPPVFRGELDVGRVMVRVLDRDRRPVRGLAAQDFEILINGVPQPVLAVVEEDSTGPVRPPAPWMREVSLDVATNRIANPRLVVIVMDDANFGASPRIDPWSMKQAKLIGKTIVAELGPSDLAAVVFTADNRSPQDFTPDRARLGAAVDRFGPTGIPGFLAARYSLRTLQSTVEFLQRDTDRPAAIFWVTPGMSLNPKALEPRAVSSGESVAEREQELSVQDQFHRLLDGATTRGIPIYPISITGLRAPAPDASGRIVVPPLGADSAFVLRDLAVATGGRAVTGTNAPSAAVPALFRELARHYTIGYRVTHPQADGRYRRLQVRVRRPNVIVEPSERMWLAPNETTSRAAIAAPQTPKTTEALARLIPLADEPLRLALAPFAIPGAASGRDERATLALALGLELPAALDGGSDQLDIEVRVFDSEGRRQIQMSRHELIVRPALLTAQDRAEVVSALTLAPGRYNVRVSVHSAVRNKSGSVYSDVEIPRFTREALSASSVLVDLAPSLPRLPIGGAWPTRVPAFLTTAREFSAAQHRATAFVRVYWGGTRQPAPVTISAAIIDDTNTKVWQRNDAITPEPASRLPRSADYRVALPLTQLRAADYLLRLTITPATGRPIERTVRFSVE